MQKTTQDLFLHCTGDLGYAPGDVVVVSFSEVNKMVSAKVCIVENLFWTYESFEEDVAKIEEIGCPCIVYTDGEKFVHIFVKSENGEYSEASDIIESGAVQNINESAIFSSILRKKIWIFRDSIRPITESSTTIIECILVAVQINREGSWAEFKNILCDSVSDEDSFKKYIGGIHERITRCQPFKFFFSEEASISRGVYASIVIFEGLDFDRFPAQVYEHLSEISRYEDRLLVNSRVSKVMTSFAKGSCAVISYEGGGFLTDLRSNCSVTSIDLYADNLLDFTCVAKYLCQDDSVFTESWILAKDYDTIIVLVPFAFRGYEYPSKSALFGDRRTELVNRVLETSLPHLKKDGVLLTVVLEGVLFSSDDAIRRYIAENYHVSVIQSFKRLFGIITSTQASLLVIDHRKSKDTLVSKNSASLEEIDDVVKNIQEYLCEGNIPKEGYVLFRNLNLENNWSSGYLCIKAEYGPNEGEERVALGEMCEILSGVSAASYECLPAGSIGGIPYLRVSDYGPDGIHLAQAVHVPGTKAKVLSQAGDIVFSTSATIGKMAIVADEVFVPSSQLVLLRCKEGYSCDKLVAALKSYEVSVQLHSMETGIVVRHISKEALRNLRIRAKEMA